MALSATKAALRTALQGPLAFARGNDGNNAAKLRGLEDLVRGQVEGGDFEAALLLVRGYDSVDTETKKRMVAALSQWLHDDAALPPPATHTPATTRPATKRIPQPAAPAAPRDVMATAVTSLRGIGPVRAAELKERGLHTVADLLACLPRTYEDRRQRMTVAQLMSGSQAVISGVVVVAGVVGGGRGRRFEAVIDDGTGPLRLLFFHFRQAEMVSRLPKGATITAVGEVKAQAGRMTMVHPRFFAGTAAPTEAAGIVPVYPELMGLHPLALQRAAHAALDLVERQPPPDALPQAVLESAEVPSWLSTMTALHRPPATMTDDELRALLGRLAPAHRRLVFEELLVMSLALAQRRLQNHQDHALPLPHHEREMSCRAEVLPFTLTRAQLRATDDICADMAAPIPMARLLQGDVGAGKTAVALLACVRAWLHGGQCAFMAPTELLAEQHGRTLKALGQRIGLRVEVLTGSLAKKPRALLEARIANRDVDVVVGTQALLSAGVRFHRLALCIVDEQHRFGVVQRALLRDKGPTINDIAMTPHLLVMTATPIPRSLALTLYGDLSVSVLDELPPGRTPVATTITGDMGAAHEMIATTVSQGERAFVVYPLIDESEVLDVQAATAGHIELVELLGPERVALLHGRMASDEREIIMAAFARGDTQVLVSTTVIEVGVDVPAATLMVVVNAERFGLAQLHQLRGRVGRGALPSRCLLVAGDIGRTGSERLRILERTNDGFVVAEADLELRGSGDLLGTRQSGEPTLAFADLARHADLISLARSIADDVIAADPRLEQAAHSGLRAWLHRHYAARLVLTQAG